ncbi:PREDICTED: uncharacterized protein LOC108550888 [Eufriesea mexicana]|uniref:uncharacterized protein LOC108550888 n=1 Tax=Eufriesea mexicana TaxID=516756 RepID=UPI00083BAB1C|nr:PREDICTED: uncharacterized protein LOC108550888 [Eufriesea mexicana]
MFDKNNVSSSSSEDETTKNAMKEATDHQFLKNRFFDNHTSKNSEISKETIKHANDNTTNVVSLRKDLNYREQFSNNFVSQSFKNYVAKKLEEIIEKSIRIKKKEKNNIINEKEYKDNNYGVKLLNSSAEVLTIEEENEEFPKFQNKRKIETIIDEKAYLLKCKQVAVNPEQILSKVDTKAWTNKRKGPEFNYKRLKNGILVEKK